MTAISTAIRVSRCLDCQARTLSTFVAFSSGVPCVSNSRTRNTSKLRLFSTTGNQSFRTTRRAELEDALSVSAGTPHQSPPAGESALSQAAQSVPWYLDMQAPDQQMYPISSRQKLPEIPTDAPEMLEPILNQLSITSGLDDITLIDLRVLDPPAALGGNLIMLLGTARSEKHLHVSADRFCRWLRTTYKLSPYADGLLGRNELKLKMRRKARRAKLLGSVGTIEKVDEDDGIRTGWVCVNVGSIGHATAVEPRIDPDEGFIGFGGEADGVKLVIQMLTQEKREELDLETLWGGFLRRQERKKQREGEKLAQEQETEEVGGTSALNVQPIADTSASTPSRYSEQLSHGLTDRRSLHTYARQSKNDMFSFSTKNLSPTAGFIIASPSLNSEEARRAYSVASKSLSDGEALARLGNNSVDSNSAGSLPKSKASRNHSDVEEWKKSLDSVIHGLRLGRSEYDTDDLKEILQEMQLSGVNMTEAMYQDAIAALMHIPTWAPASDDQSSSVLDTRSFMMVLDLLEDMNLRGIQIMNNTVISSILFSLARFGGAGEDPSFPKLQDKALWQFARLLEKRDIAFGSCELHCQVLSLLASTGQWDTYWRYWRGIPRRMEHRPQALYTAMFQHVAETNHQSKTVEALTLYIPELELEQPPVLLDGSLCEAVMDCIRVAQPDIELEVAELPNEAGQWVRLWRRCLSGLDPDAAH